MRRNRFDCLLIPLSLIFVLAIEYVAQGGFAKPGAGAAPQLQGDNHIGLSFWNSKHDRVTPIVPEIQGATSGTIGPRLYSSNDRTGTQSIQSSTGLARPSFSRDSAGFLQLHIPMARQASLSNANPSTGVPELQGATNGTIGPPSLAPTLPGVAIDQTVIPAKRESSVIPTLLFASLAFSLIFVGVRSIVFKKRAPLFVLGMIAAGALMLVGFMFSFYQPVPLAEAPRIYPSLAKEPAACFMHSCRLPRYIEPSPSQLVPKPTAATATATLGY